jgi:hypothetical protein
MPTDEDAFWDRLGVSWRVSIGDVGLISSGLRARLRLQGLIVSAAALAGATVSLGAAMLAAWTFYVGWTTHAWNFLTRGLTLTVVAVLAGMMTLLFRERHRVETGSLSDMLRASIVRTERLIRAVNLGCAAAVVLALGGLIGYALRVRLDRPPAMSPVEDLLILIVLASVLLWYRHRQAHALRTYRQLSRAVDSEEGSG